MTRPKFINCAFDPNQCPLLQGLSAEEQKQRMADDPLIRQCIAHLGESGAYPSPCSDIIPNAIRAGKTRRRKAAATA